MIPARSITVRHFSVSARENAQNASGVITIGVVPSLAYFSLISAEATVAAAATPGEQCEAQFYVGEWRLLRGDQIGAAAAWQAAVDRCPRSFIEYKGARAELKRLNPP